MKIGKYLAGSIGLVVPGWDRAINDDFDRVVLVIGKEGVGKSTLALILGKLYALYRSKNLGSEVKFTPKKNVYYDLNKFEKDVMSKDTLPGQIRIVDEAVTAGGYRGGYNTRDNKSLDKLLMKCRSKNQLIFFLIPNINKVSPYIIERAATVIRVVGRGRAYIYNEAEKNKFVKKYSNKYYFQKPPALDNEQYNTVEWHLGESFWNEYKEHKDIELSEGLESAEDINSQNDIYSQSRFIKYEEANKIGAIGRNTWAEIRQDNKVIKLINKAGTMRVGYESFLDWLNNNQ